MCEINKLECQICGYTAKQLHQHLKAVHKLTSFEYRGMFGLNAIMQIGFIPNTRKSKSNYVSKGYEEIKNKLKNITELYDYDETKLILINNDTYLKYFGKSGNRTAIKNNPKLYKSILYYTSFLDSINQYAFSKFTNRLKFIVFSNCELEYIKCKCGQTYTFNKYCRHCPDYKRTMLGKLKSPEERQNLRLKAIKRIEKRSGQIMPNYNPNSIAIIEQFGKDNGYNFMHAENGGEFRLKDLGYWADAYDPVNNIWLEIDEHNHFRNGKLLEKDILRQREIENHLKCKFYRIQI